MICSQCLIFGSNKVDFLKGNLYDHELISSNLYIPAQADIADRYQFYHDYVWNSTSMHLCLREDEKEEESVVQKRSPGLIMIVEIEDIRLNLDDSTKLLQRTTSALEQVGQNIVNASTFSTNVGAFMTLILHDGYVLVRTWRDKSYAAVDVHLWSKFNQIDALKDVLVVAFESAAAPSSFRIVAGGMFGVSAWKLDERQRGPHLNVTCTNRGSSALDTSVDKTVAPILLEETWKIVNDEDTSVVVLCGDDKDVCASVEVLKKLGVKHIMPLYSCHGVDNEFAEGAADRMDLCGMAMYSMLRESVTDNKKFGAVIVDDSAPRSMARVAYKILKAWRGALLEKSLFIMAVIFEDGSIWRRHLLERFRKDIIHYDPNFRAEVLFNTSDSSMELGITRSGDRGFVEKIKKIMTRVEQKTGMTWMLHQLLGGQYEYEHDWKASHYFLPADYDQRSPFEQWKSQRPLGYQTVFQFESIDDDVVVTYDAIKAALIGALSGLDSKIFVNEAKGVAEAELTELGQGVIGNGALLVASWSGGNCALLWDGRGHVDLNLFTFEESPKFAKAVAFAFKAGFGKAIFNVALQDIQPRGDGRVVNLKSDINDVGKVPHWAKFKVEQ